MAKLIGQIVITFNPRLSWGEMQSQEDEEIRHLGRKARAKDDTGLECVGEEVRFPIADGYARYLVSSAIPLELTHIAAGDGWQIPGAHMRGLELGDIIHNVSSRKSMEQMFRKHAGKHVKGKSVFTD